MTAPIFNIIIKINFNMFLLHVLPQIYFIGQTRMSTYFSNMHNVSYVVRKNLLKIIFFLILALFSVSRFSWSTPRSLRVDVNRRTMDRSHGRSTPA